MNSLKLPYIYFKVRRKLDFENKNAQPMFSANINELVTSQFWFPKYKRLLNDIYRQDEMYNREKYLKNLPLQSVSSRRNLQAEDKFRNHVRFVCA